MSLYCSTGGPEVDLSSTQLRDLLLQSLAKLGDRSSVLAVPPDYSRVHSRAGDLTRFAWKYYGERFRAVLPALGTHRAMQADQIERMFGGVPANLFRVHNWRTDVETLGEVPSDFVRVAFVICTFWLIEALSAAGRRAEARAVFERIHGALSPLGLLSEDFDPSLPRMWGNFPQTYSHV